MPTAERTRVDVDRVKERDAVDGSSQDLLAARMVAVIEARRAHARREAGAAYALRASLVDLAAVAEALASDLNEAKVGTERSRTLHNGTT